MSGFPIGFAPRRANVYDREMVLLGSVGVGFDNEPAATRTGAARLINTRLDSFDIVKFVLTGGASDSAGGYLIDVAAVDQGGAIGDASTYATIGTIVASGEADVEVVFRGQEIREAVADAGSLTGDVRCVAVRLTAGTGGGGNGTTAPTGTTPVIFISTPGV